MTATAEAPAGAPPCPKCGGGMWNQKYGKFPWKPGTPIFKCKDKECAATGGVIWEPKGPPTKAAPTPERPRLTANVAEKDLPPLLQGAEKEDAAELQRKIGFDIATIQRELALYQSLTEWVNSTIAPIYQKSGVGMSPESAVAATATLFINTAGKK